MTGSPKCRSLRELRKAVKAKIKATEQPETSYCSSEYTAGPTAGDQEDDAVSKLTAAITGMASDISHKLKA